MCFLVRSALTVHFGVIEKRGKIEKNLIKTETITFSPCKGQGGALRESKISEK